MRVWNGAADERNTLRAFKLRATMVVSAGSAWCEAHRRKRQQTCFSGQFGFTGLTAMCTCICTLGVGIRRVGRGQVASQAGVAVLDQGFVRRRPQRPGGIMFSGCPGASSTSIISLPRSPYSTDRKRRTSAPRGFQDSVDMEKIIAHTAQAFQRLPLSLFEHAHCVYRVDTLTVRDDDIDNASYS